MTRDDPDRWSALTPEALQDEIDTNRHDERGLLVIALVAAVVTAVVLVLHGVVA